MKIGLYSPFMAETLGGGERYFLTVAECLLAQKCEVDLIFQDNFFKNEGQRKKWLERYKQAFNVELTNVGLINGPFGKIGSVFERLRFTRKYDAFYYLTDGSFFIPAAKRNLVHFMIPFKKPCGGFFNKLKLSFWQIITSNSLFTKKILEKNWGVKVDYIHGGIVDVKSFKPLPKKKIILNVGRFFSGVGGRHCKRQDFLVETFKKMCDWGLEGWQLILVGAVDTGLDNTEYAKKVGALARNYPILLKHEVSHSELKKLYGTATIYWHATGYGLDEEREPEAMEHLGITTIEAMAAGAVPVVIHKGGQREIVTEGKDGLFWETQEELINKTEQVIGDPKLRLTLAENALKRAQDYSKEKFCQMTQIIFGLKQ